MPLKASDFNVRHLGTVPVTYSAQAIRTEALKVTPENIGPLSVELHVGLNYISSKGLLYLQFDRGEVEEPQAVEVQAGDWIVALWEQLYLFKEAEFRHTFKVNEPRVELFPEELAVPETKIRGNLEQ